MVGFPGIKGLKGCQMRDKASFALRSGASFLGYIVSMLLVKYMHDYNTVSNEAHFLRSTTLVRLFISKFYVTDFC